MQYLAYFITFTLLLTVELTVFIHSNINALTSKIETKTKSAVQQEVKKSLEQSFLSSLLPKLDKQNETKDSILKLNAKISGTLTRVSEPLRPIASEIALIQSDSFLQELTESVNTSWKTSPLNGFKITEMLLQRSKDYWIIDSDTYDWKEYWTDAWHEFSAKLRQRKEISKSWVFYLSERQMQDNWKQIKETKSYVTNHGFSAHHAEPNNISTVIGNKNNLLKAYRNIEIFDNKVAILWKLDEQGFRTKELIEVKIVDLESAPEIKTFIVAIRDHSKPLTSSIVRRYNRS